MYELNMIKVHYTQMEKCHNETSDFMQWVSANSSSSNNQTPRKEQSSDSEDEGAGHQA